MNKLALTLVAALVTSLTSATAAKAKIEFSRDLAGTYSGTYFVTTGGGGSGAGNITARVTVPKSGNKLSVNLNGFITASTTIPIACTLRFDSRRKLKSDAALLGLLSPTLTSPAKFSGKNGNFNFTLTAAPGATLSGAPFTSAIGFQMRLSKKVLTISGNGAIDTGSSFPITINVSLNRWGKK